MTVKYLNQQSAGLLLAERPLFGRRFQADPRYSYKLDNTHAPYGIDVVTGGHLEVDVNKMCIRHPFVDGNNRDGVGDLMEVGGVRTDRHQKNPVWLFDHGKEVTLPIGRTEDDEGHYTVNLDQSTQTGDALVFYYQGRNGEVPDAFLADDDSVVPGIGKKFRDHALFCEQVFDLVAQKFLRGGSIGYQVVKAMELSPNYETGAPKGLHLLVTLMLEGSTVVMPANQETVRKMLSMGYCCGKRMSPYLVKSLTPYAPPKKATISLAGIRTKGITKDVGNALRKVGENLASRKEPPLPMPGYGQIFSNEGEVWYVGGDGDDDGFTKVVEKEIRKAYPGVSKIHCEAEAFPPKEEGWIKVYPPDEKRLSSMGTKRLGDIPHYRHADMLQQRCGNCKSYNLYSEGVGHCKMFDATVGEGMTCDEWHKKEGEKAIPKEEFIGDLGWRKQEEEEGSHSKRIKTLRVKYGKALPSSNVTPEKAKQILKDGKIRGHPLTPAQRRMFGAAAGRGKKRTGKKEMVLKRVKDLRLKYRAGFKRIHRKGHPTSAFVYVHGKDLPMAEEDAKSCGLKFERTGTKGGLERVRLTGTDDGINEVARKYGRK